MGMEDVLVPVAENMISRFAEKQQEEATDQKKFNFWQNVVMLLMYYFILSESIFDVVFASTELAQTDGQYGTGFVLVVVALVLALIGLVATIFDGQVDDIKYFYNAGYGFEFMKGVLRYIFTPFRYDELYNQTGMAQKRRTLVWTHRLADFGDVLLLTRLIVNEQTCPEVTVLDYIVVGLLWLSVSLVATDYLTCAFVDRTQGGIFVQAISAYLSVMIFIIVPYGNAKWEFQWPFLVGLGALLFPVIFFIKSFGSVLLLAGPAAAVAFRFLQKDSVCNINAATVAITVYSFIPAFAIIMRKLNFVPMSKKMREQGKLVFGSDPFGWLRYTEPSGWKSAEFVSFVISVVDNPYERVDKRFKDDETVLSNACHGLFVMQFASDRLKDDKDFVMKIMALNPQGSCVEYASERIQNDEEVGLLAVNYHGTNLGILGAESRDNPTIVRAALKKHGYALDAVSERLQDDKEIVLLALSDPRARSAIRFASKRLQNDPDVIEASKKPVT